MTSIQPTQDASIATVQTDALPADITTERKQYVIAKALAAIGTDQIKAWQSEAATQFPDPSSFPTITLSNGGQLRRNDDTLEGLPIGASDWQPIAWLTVDDLGLFAQLVPTP